jgi:hypothetical protein
MEAGASLYPAQSGSSSKGLTSSLLSGRTDELIETVRPKQASHERRLGVQSYVKKLITKCFHPEEVRKNLQHAIGAAGSWLVSYHLIFTSTGYSLHVRISPSEDVPSRWRH